MYTYSSGSGIIMMSYPTTGGPAAWFGNCGDPLLFLWRKGLPTSAFSTRAFSAQNIADFFDIIATTALAICGGASLGFGFPVVCRIRGGVAGVEAGRRCGFTYLWSCFSNGRTAVAKSGCR